MHHPPLLEGQSVAGELANSRFLLIFHPISHQNETTNQQHYTNQNMEELKRKFPTIQNVSWPSVSFFGFQNLLSRLIQYMNPPTVSKKSKNIIKLSSFFILQIVFFNFPKIGFLLMNCSVSGFYCVGLLRMEENGNLYESFLVRLT
jgi:hypothetical protein